MSNNAINVRPTFRDSNGRPRAYGLVYFYDNETTTLASIYSDEDLATPQANPYTLDAYGRITGNVKYNGSLTVKVTNSDGSDVHTDDNVSTSAGDISATQQFEVIATDPPTMTVTVRAGKTMSGEVLVSKDNQTTTTITAPVSNPRIDRIVVDRITGVYSIITGAEAANPTAPAITTGNAPLAQFQLETSTISITDAMISDERVSGSIETSIASTTETLTNKTITSPVITTPTVTFSTGDAVRVSGYHVSTGLYANKSLSVASEETAVKGLALNSDDTECYIIGFNNTVYQYTLTTAGDVSTGGYSSKSMSVSTEVSGPRGIAVGDSNTKVYTGGSSVIYQYNLSVASDISTGAYAGKSLDFSAQSATIEGLSFSPDGAICYILSSTASTIYQYTLSTPWDISTGSYASKSYNANGEDTDVTDISVSSDGKKFFLMGSTTDYIMQYNFANEQMLEAEFTGDKLETSDQITNPEGLAISSDGTKCYAVGSNDIIYQYSIGILIV